MPMKDALFTPSQAKVYALIFGQPDRGFHLNELRRLTGLASASLQREVNRLFAAGLVVSENVGNLRRISANKQSPVFTPLFELIQKTMGAEPILREALQPLSKEIELALIYGSVAKGTDTANSDIDLMVVSDSLGISNVLQRTIEAEQQLGRTVNPTCYTVKEFQTRLTDPASFVNRVMAQPTIWLLGDRKSRG